MDTLLLSQTSWDLTLDAMGNIAKASDGYAIAQDVASACRTFRGEIWYNTNTGVPYFQQILGKLPPAQFVKAQEEAAAESVPDVASAKCFLTGFQHRTLTGQIQITTTAGQTLAVGGNIQGNVPWYVSAVSAEAAF